MTSKDAVDFIRKKIQIDVRLLTDEEVETTIEVLNMAISALEKQEGKKPITVETNIYDTEEIHHNCTVQVLRNSVTGDVSVGWWEEKEEEE